jgi:hypothetical protein
MEVVASTRYRVAMLPWVIRVAIVRFLGRRVVPLLVAFDLFRMLLAARRAWMRPRTDR